MELDCIILYPTLRCNLRCAHCWIEAEKTSIFSELRLQEMMSTIDSALDLGLNSVRITGGEPFLREEVTLELLKYLDELKITAAVETNGTLLSAQSKKVIAETRPNIMVSMDGATPHGFASLRGTPSLFDTVVKNIMFLRDAGIPITCSMSIHKGNVDELDAFVEMAQSFGRVRLLLYLEMGRARELKSKFTIQESIALMKRMNSFMKENPHINSNLPMAFLDLDVLFHACYAGRDSLAVLPDGSVSFCAYCTNDDNMIAGNIRESPLEELWENGLIFDQCRNIHSSLEGICGRCIFKEYCQGSCRAWAYDVYDSLYAPYPLCQTAYEEGLFPEEYLLEEEP